MGNWYPVDYDQPDVNKSWVKPPSKCYMHILLQTMHKLSFAV